ncbi:MAG: hypothetical protein HOJ25_00155 [Candidatus Magasanikbacteria bacterium]|nr:hypothetical protein [Candidatus Magasanikbacteria bacterium]MBT5819852.1 hypothetical protein [Candidatus Magasanikbacteria bacterium]MBT6294090.1 hypothetical protein [Candidatus Magasanikbacteria bacterium]
MGKVREVLFGKVDLDTLTTALVLGLNPQDVLFKCIAGSAKSSQLQDKSVVAIEVGGSGRTTENNFDHHPSPGEHRVTNLSACAQALERLARLVRYVDELDRGIFLEKHVESGGFPSLSQLVSGMLLSIRNPQERVTKGIEILSTVLQSGIDPYGCMEDILDHVDGGRLYTKTKRDHDRLFEQVVRNSQWHTTATGLRLAVVETTWVGAPGALYGHGAQAVVVCNPEMRKRSGKGTHKKFTIAVNGSEVPEGTIVTPALEELNTLESGWGGPSQGTIGGSPVGTDSSLSLETVVGEMMKI